MDRSEDFIKKHMMEPHPEGGYFRRLHSSSFLFALDQNRKASSSVHYLLKPGEKSLFHRIDAEEVWYHDDGCDMLLVLLYPDGSQEEQRIGKNGVKAFCVPPGTWMAATPIEEDFSSVICHVTPEFVFEGFQLADRDYLLKRYPNYKETIMRFTIAPE